MSDGNGHKALVKKLAEAWEPEPMSGCWLWLRARDQHGYGRVGKVQHGTQYAHRAVYEAEVAPIPPSRQIDHLCFNKSCVNPRHLRVVTPRENSQRTPRAMQTACKRGHPFTEENTYTWESRRGTMRRCRKCAAQYQRDLRCRAS